jgi:hypothetical protein
LTSAKLTEKLLERKPSKNKIRKFEIILTPLNTILKTK